MGVTAPLYLPPMLQVGVADRAADLVDRVVELLVDPLPDPFQSEWVSVPSFGFRSWLRFELASRLGVATGGTEATAGIAANIEMPFPGSLRWRVLRAHRALGGPDSDSADPWEVDRLVWTVLDVMSDPAAEIDQKLRRSELPTGVTLASRAGPIADLFDRYGVHRPQMVLEWAKGRNVDADGNALAPERAWQPKLYRAVRDRVVARHGVLPPAERLVDALGQIRAGALDLSAPISATEPGLPPRLLVVGQSILTAELGPVLSAVAEQTEVHLLMLSPSAAATVDLAESVAGSAIAPAGTTSWAFRRKDRPSPAVTPLHPLVEGWGRRPLESALLLGAGGVVPQVIGGTSSGSSGNGIPPPTTETRLSRIQRDLRWAHPPAGDHHDPVPDRSLQVHAAPGRTRQVEVLRDVLLGLLRDDPSLSEHEIAVLCPQLDEFAPVITAVLGAPARRGEQPGDGVPALRYTLIDRDARSFNPVLAAMQTVLEVVPGRFDTAAVRDLLHSAAVRNRFGLTDDDLGLFSEWLDEAGVRWGLDGSQRGPWGIDSAYRANSWAAAVDQIMVGVALGDPLRSASIEDEERLEVVPDSSPHALAVGDIAPLDIAEGDVASAGRVAAALRSLATVHQLLVGRSGSQPTGTVGDSQRRTIGEWRDLLTRAADLLFEPARFEDWQRTALDDALANLVSASTDADGSPSTSELTFGDVRRLLAPALEGQRARADLGYGSIVVARPALLTGVPFRVVCILGLDEDAMPSAESGGDDLLVALPHVGDREPRVEARAELLAALQAATDTFIVTCTSRDVRTNAAVPRSLVLDELLDVVTATVASPDPHDPHHPGAPSAQEAAQALVRSHPRQAFDPTNFVAAGHDSPFSFDATARDGAEAILARLAAGTRSTGPALLLTSPLPEPTGPEAVHEVVDLADLKRFYDHPVKHFFRERLQITLPREAEKGDDQLPTTLDKLKASNIGGDLVAIGMALGDPELVRISPSGPSADTPEEVRALLTYHRARGVLPPPAAANPELAALSDEVADILRLAVGIDALRAADQSHDVDIALAGGAIVRGMASRCCGGGAPGPLRLMYNRFKPKYLASAAMDLLTLTAAKPEVAWRSVVITRGASKKPPQSFIHVVRGANAQEREDAARVALHTLIGQFRDGSRYPLPLFDATSYAIVRGAGPRSSPRTAASTAWGKLVRDQWSYKDECLDEHHQLAFGKLDFEDLEDLEAGGHTFAGEAHRLWGTLDVALERVDPGSVGS